jgi:hypothetical protein
MPERVITGMSGKAGLAAVLHEHGVLTPTSFLVRTTEKELESVFLEVSVSPPKKHLIHYFGLSVKSLRG